MWNTRYKNNKIKTIKEMPNTWWTKNKKQSRVFKKYQKANDCYEEIFIQQRFSKIATCDIHQKFL